MYKPTITESEIPMRGFQLIKKTQNIEVFFENHYVKRHRSFLKIKEQILPLGENNKTFTGYPTIFHAYFAIEKKAPNDVSIIYQTEVDALVPPTSNQNWFGRFYVYVCFPRRPQTGNPTITIPPSELPKGTIRGIAMHVAPHPRKGFQFDIESVYMRFELDINKGKKPFDVNGKEAHSFYKKAFTSTPYFTDKEFESSSSQMNDNEKGYLNSSLIHILNATDIFGRVSKVDSSGRELSISSRKEFSVFDSQKLFDYSISITEDSLTRTLAQNLRTFAHEGIHVLQGYRANYVLKKWRSQNITIDLERWIKIEARKPNSEIRLIDIIYALENYSPKESTQKALKKAIELESYLNTFILALSFFSSSNMSKVSIELLELLSYLDKAAIKYVEPDPTNKWTRMMFDKYSIGLLLIYVGLEKRIQNVLLREIEKRTNDPKIQTLYTWIFEMMERAIIVKGKKRRK